MEGARLLSGEVSCKCEVQGLIDIQGTQWPSATMFDCRFDSYVDGLRLL